jgi:hypothetical protein
MKAKMLVNLRTENGKLVYAGTVFSEPFPEFVKNNLENAKIIKQIPGGDVKEVPVVNTKSILPAEAEIAKEGVNQQNVSRLVKRK